MSVMMIWNRFMKAPVATDWVTAPDIQWDGVDGRNIILSDGMLLAPPPVDATNVSIEVEFAETLILLGSGTINAWVFIIDYPGDITTTEGNLATAFYTGAARTNTTAKRVRKVILRPSVLHFYNSTFYTSFVRPRVRGQGSAVGTEWQVTDIRARVIYTPL